jgi:cell division protein FtsQ
MAKQERKPARPQSRLAEPEGFWDKPVLLNLVADLFFVFALLVLGWAALAALQRLPVFPLREVVVLRPLEQVSRGQIEHAARTALVGNVLTANIDTARVAFEKMPWVRRAEVRRRWPDSLELTLEEHVAAARWHPPEGENLLVNQQGEVFAAPAPAGVVLPIFSGPEGSSAMMLARYREIETALATLGRRTAAVALSARQAWELRLDDGMIVQLGRDQTKHPVTERLARLVEHLPAARTKVNVAVGVADMRYPNGFVLRSARGGKAS